MASSTRPPLAERGGWRAIWLLLLMALGFYPLSPESEISQNSHGNAETAVPTDPNVGRRAVAFAGYRWYVKESELPIGPMANRFGGSAKSVRNDQARGLILSLTQRGGFWYAAEVVLDRSLGYGRYTVKLESFLDRLDPNLVIGLFTWDDDPAEANREIDIEFSYWGGDTYPFNSQFVVQPYDRPSNLERFTLPADSGALTCRIDWKPDEIRFIIWRGHGAEPPTEPISADAAEGAKSVPLWAWSYQGDNLKRPGAERFRINLYLVHGRAPTDGQTAQLAIADFSFSPFFDPVE